MEYDFIFELLHFLIPLNFCMLVIILLMRFVRWYIKCISKFYYGSNDTKKR